MFNFNIITEMRSVAFKRVVLALCFGSLGALCFGSSYAVGSSFSANTIADTVSSGCSMSSYCYAERDTARLWLDVYRPDVLSASHASDVSNVSNVSNVLSADSCAQRGNKCVIYVFGGGFVTGSRDQAGNVAFYRSLVERGYTVVAIDYRLGLRGVTRVGATNPRPAFAAVDMATEDLLSATRFVIDNRVELGVDTSQIVVVGSSAGAITVLQADYQMSRGSEMVREAGLDGYRYAGVVSMAGALFSTHGRPRYGDVGGVRGAAPTLFFHGTSDKVVIYKKIQVFNLGMFGTDALVKVFNKNEYPYCAIRYRGSKHEVAEFPRVVNLDVICDFMERCFVGGSGKYSDQVDVSITDRDVQAHYKSNLKLKDLYNGN